MDRFSKYIGRSAVLTNGAQVTIVSVVPDDISGKPLLYIKYDNGSVDSVYMNSIEFIEADPNGSDMDMGVGMDNGNIPDDSGPENNRIFGGESKMKKGKSLTENYSVEELSNIFTSRNKRVQEMKALADDDRVTGVLMDFSSDVEGDVTDADNFVDAMLEPFRSALIEKVNSLIENDINKGENTMEPKEKKKISEKRATTTGFAGETVLVNDLIMDISTNRKGNVKEILENGDVKADFNGKIETHAFRTFMKI